MKNTIHLQGIGDCPAVPASEIKIGDFLMWNYGGILEVRELVKETPHFREFSVLCDGKLYRQKLKKTRLVCRVSQAEAVAETARNGFAVTFFENKKINP